MDQKPPYQTPVQVVPPQPVVTSPMPNLPGPNIPAKPPEVGEEQKKLKGLEKMMEIMLGFNIITGGFLLLVIVLVVVWRFNLGDYLNKRGLSSQNAQIKQEETKTSQAKLAEAKIEPAFISEQVIEPKNFGKPVTQLHYTISGRPRKEIFGYLPYWMVDKSDQIDTKMLTSVTFFAFDVDGNGNLVKTGSDGKLTTAWAQWQNSAKLDAFIKNAKKNRIKVYVTLKNFDASNIEKLVQSPAAYVNFIDNALYLVNSKSLDGINVDFEYIGTPDSKVIDGFSLLMSNLNTELKRQYPKAQLTISTFVDAAAATRIHDAEILAQVSDALVVMGYDFHTPKSAQAGALAPMEGAGISIGGFMSSYLEKIQPNKIILTVGYYGYDWPVKAASANAEVIGTRNDVKVYPYADIVEATKRTNFNWDENSKTPWYSYTDSTTGYTRVVHFENARSLGVKYDYVNQKNLKGVGIWALGFDGENPELVQLLADKFAN